MTQSEDVKRRSECDALERAATLRWLVEFMPLKVRQDSAPRLEQVAGWLGVPMREIASLMEDGRLSHLRYQVESESRAPGSLPLMTLMEVADKFGMRPNTLLVAFSKRALGTWYRPRLRFHADDSAGSWGEVLSLRQVDIRSKPGGPRADLPIAPPSVERVKVKGPQHTQARGATA